ncbi:MAG: LPS export ABC transporter permease LptG [Pseudomonadota bacterium]
MRILNRYIAQHIIQATALSCLLLLGIEHFFALFHELKFIGTGDYGLMQALAYLLFLLPQKFYLLFPMAMLLGGILGLGSLASNAEIIAMRAAGLSYHQLIRAALLVGLFLAIITCLIGELLVPVSERIAQNHRAFTLTGGQALLTDKGKWMRDRNAFIHIHDLEMSGRLAGITRYEFDDDFHLKKASYATEAKREGDHWLLFDIQNTYFGADNGRTTNEHLIKERWDTDLDPEVLRVVGMKTIDQLNLRGLSKAIQFRAQNGLDVQAYQLSFWSKVFRPFAYLAPYGRQTLVYAC